MKILALDPATQCGWAHSEGPCGTWDLSVRRDESSGMRFIRLRAKLSEIKAGVGIDVLVFEASRNMKFGHAVRIAGGLQAVIETWCIDNGVEYRAYSATEIKKYATGKGNADKNAMAFAASEYFSDAQLFDGKRPADDNQIDALWCLELAKRDFDPAGIGS